MPADTRALKGCTPPRPAGCSRRLQLTRNVSRLGGPVGVELCELLRAQGKPVSGMIYAEGNLVTPARSCAPCSGAAMLALIPPKSVFSLRGAGVQDAGDCFGSARLVQKGCPLAPGEGASAARRERWDDRHRLQSSSTVGGGEDDEFAGWIKASECGLGPRRYDGRFPPIEEWLL